MSVFLLSLCALPGCSPPAGGAPQNEPGIADDPAPLGDIDTGGNAGNGASAENPDADAGNKNAADNNDANGDNADLNADGTYDGTYDGGVDDGGADAGNNNADNNDANGDKADLNADGTYDGAYDGGVDDGAYDGGVDDGAYDGGVDDGGAAADDGIGANTGNGGAFDGVKYAANKAPGAESAFASQPVSYTLDSLPDDVYSFAVNLDGTIFSLPAPYRVFEQYGWDAKNLSLSETVIGSEKTELVEMVNGGHTVYMGFMNDSPTAKALKDCEIGILFIGEPQTGTGTAFMLPGGLSIGAEYNEIVSRYGMESSRSDFSWAVTLIYKEKNSWLELELDVATLKIININYRNFERSEKLPEYEGVPPDLPGEYAAPAKLADAWQSLECVFGGSIYRLPVPAAELVKNGWIFVTDENYMLEADSGAYPAELRKDNQVLFTQLANPSGEPQPLKYCYAHEISYDKHNTRTGLELPGGLTETSPYEDFVNAYGEPDYTDDKAAMFIYYSYISEGGGLDITWSIESSKIVKLTLRANY